MKQLNSQSYCRACGWRWALVAGLLALSCNLNPQPEPPLFAPSTGMTGSAGGSTATGGSAAGGESTVIVGEDNSMSGTGTGGTGTGGLTGAAAGASDQGQAGAGEPVVSPPVSTDAGAPFSPDAGPDGGVQ